MIHAESIRFVQWWGEYLPHHGKILPGWYQGKRSIQYQDVNGDGVYNDALIWYGFGLKDPLNPASYRDTDKQNHRYRVDYPSARFYGGVVARFTNVSHITYENKKGKKVPFFTGIQQATVQPSEGASPCTYTTKSPHNTGRLWSGWAYGIHWGDMTVMVVNKGGDCCPFSEKFQKTKKAEVNFTSLFVWKKEDFINGGAVVDKITFDNTSKLSVDITRFRKNIEEGRFVVQDGDQLWISEGAVVQNEEGRELSKGVEGMTVKNSVVELNPLNSRWAPYTPFSSAESEEEKIDSLLKPLEEMAFNPKRSTAEEQQLYHEKSDELFDEINKIAFDPTKATFADHTFEDVQAVGVYFATYPFAHETTQLVFDNFQAYATGIIPKAKAVAINTKNLRDVSTDAEFNVGLSVNCGPFEQVITLCSPDKVDFSGQIIVEEKDIGQLVDLLLVIGCKQYPEAEEEIFYMLDSEGAFRKWDGNLAKLVAFQKEFSLSEQSVQVNGGEKMSVLIEQTALCKGMDLPVFLRLFFGYQLQDGKLVYNPQSIDLIITPENLNPVLNELPYSESIKGLCPAKN
jgi:putative methionine-R-sulfoxide reductase with GAF domain